MAKTFQGAGGGGGGRRAFQSYQGEQVQEIPSGYLETLANSYAQIGQGIANLGKSVGKGIEKYKAKKEEEEEIIQTAKATAGTTVSDKDIDDGVKNGTLRRKPDGSVELNPDHPDAGKLDQGKIDLYNKYLRPGAEPISASEAKGYLRGRKIQSEAAKAAQEEEDAKVERSLKAAQAARLGLEAAAAPRLTELQIQTQEAQLAAAKAAADVTRNKTMREAADYYSGIAQRHAQGAAANLALGNQKGADYLSGMAQNAARLADDYTRQAFGGQTTTDFAFPTVPGATAPSPERAALASGASNVGVNPYLANTQGGQPAPAAPSAPTQPAAPSTGLSPAQQGQQDRIAREREAARFTANANAPADEQIPAPTTTQPPAAPAAPAVRGGAAMRGEAPAAPAAPAQPAATPAAPAAPTAPTASVQPAARPTRVEVQNATARRRQQLEAEADANRNRAAVLREQALRYRAAGMPNADIFEAQADAADKIAARAVESASKTGISEQDVNKRLNTDFPAFGNWVSVGRVNYVTGIDPADRGAIAAALTDLTYDSTAPTFKGSATDVQQTISDLSQLHSNLIEMDTALQNMEEKGDRFLNRFKLTTEDLDTYAAGEVGQKFLLASLRKAIVSGGNFSDADREFILEAIPYLNSADPTKSAAIMKAIASKLGVMANRMYESKLEGQGLRYSPLASDAPDKKGAKVRDEFLTRFGIDKQNEPQRQAELRDLTLKLRADRDAMGYRYSPRAIEAAARFVAPEPPRR